MNAPKRASAASSRRHDIAGLAAWLALSYLAAAIGGFASAQAQAFYGALLQPSWAPPSWLFAPVWTALYTAMGFAAWLVWRAHGFASSRAALWLFIVQLAVNAVWSWLFFVWRMGAVAFADIALLWVLLAIMLVAFWRVRPLAGVLLLPYLVWVSFATALAFRIWRLNPQILGA
jgi:tryptophan-rich sensory protein